MDNLTTYIESLVFASDQPISRDDVRYALENCFDTSLAPEDIDIAVEALKEKYQDDGFSIEVSEIAGGLQFMTKPSYHHVIGSHLKLITNKRLSRVALETLAIIAYKQPVTKSELEKIRGVNCDYAIQKLLEKELISMAGRSDGPGRPLLYATSEKFMDYLGIKDIQELPKLRDIEPVENSIGEAGPVDEITVEGVANSDTPSGVSISESTQVSDADSEE